MERSRDRCRADATQFAAKFAKWFDGRRLYCNCVHEWRATRGVCRGRRPFGDDIQRGNLYRSGAGGDGDGAPVVIEERPPTAQALRQDRARATGKGCDSTLTAESQEKLKVVMDEFRQPESTAAARSGRSYRWRSPE